MTFGKRIGLSFTAILALSACASLPFQHAADDVRYDALVSDTLTPFSSKADYQNWRRQAERLQAKRRKERQAQGGNDDDVVIVTGSRQSGPNITNVQNQGVDEGDIVKQVGDHLVLMQDGRLFSLDIGSGVPKLAARLNMYDEVDEDIWYDELLVSGRRLVVTGYHYGKEATEISRFALDAEGQFSRQGTWYLESEDYYSGDNSATRMIGDTLIFHTEGTVDDPDAWPALRRKGETQTQSILRASDIYPPSLRLADPSLHMVTECKLTQDLKCNTRAVMADWRAEWIVTEDDGYLWVAAPGPDRYAARRFGDPKRSQPNTLYRFPLGTNKVEAVSVDARLKSRFAFDVKDNRVLAVVSPNGDEDDLALLDMPMSDFSTRPSLTARRNFTPLPGAFSYRMKTRFTENHLIYSNKLDDTYAAYVMDLETRLPPIRMSVPHTINRLDRVGKNAVLIGRRPNYLNISWLDLSSAPTLSDTLSLANRFETEGRAQALNMRVDEDGSAVLGLPTYFDGTHADGWDFDEEEDGTDISFTRVSAFGQLSEWGTAKGDPSRLDPNYECETSCVDWYGNARPFFIGDRIFALIASELIELQETPGGLVERSRVNLSAAL